MANNQAASLTLAQWINQLRAANGIVKDAAQALVPVVRVEIAKAIQEGRSVDGERWLAKYDGSLPLRHAMDAITVRAIDNVIVVTLFGHHVFHHFGTSRVPRRPILPTKGLPQKLGQAIARGLVDMGEAWMKRKGRHDRGSGGARMMPSMTGKG